MRKYDTLTGQVKLKVNGLIIGDGEASWGDINNVKADCFVVPPRNDELNLK